MNRMLAPVSAAALAAILLTPLAATAMAQSDEAVQAEGRALLEEVVKAYRDAPTLTDTITMSVGPDQQTFEVRFNQGNERIEMTVPGMVIAKIGDEMIFVSDISTDKYLSVPIDEDIIKTAESIFGANAGLPFHMYVRSGRDLDAIIESFGMGMLPQPTFSEMRTVSDDNDKEFRELVFTSLAGGMTVRIHPETKLVHHIQLNIDPPDELGMMESLDAKVAMEPVVAAELAKPITFDPGDREAVNSADALMPAPPVAKRAGDVAPEFELQTLEGESVKLADLKGSVVVLDFWATWCVPCIRALPKVDEFAQWAKESNHPIKVYAVNVWERQRGEGRAEMVRAFWKDKGYRLPTLMDTDDSVVAEYGFQSIPTTVIIGPDGKIFKVHVGFSPEIDKELREDALKALEVKG